MMAGTATTQDGRKLDRALADVEELQRRLEEAEQAIDAIRSGQVDSLIVDGPGGPRVFSLEGEDHSYRVLVESMNEGAATLGEDGTILYCNARFAAMLDLPLEQVMGSPIFRYLPAGSWTIFHELAAATGGFESRREASLVDGKGHVIPAMLSMSAIHEGCCKLCLIAADLRAQKEPEELARSVLEQAAEAIVVCNERAQVVRASSMAADLCGKSPLGASFDSTFALTLDPAPASGPHGSIALRALLGESIRAASAWLARSDGTRVDLMVSAAPLRIGEGPAIGCIITMMDVSARKRSEEALRALNQELADADRRKGEFIAVLSHELRNPLAPITNCLSILDSAAPGSDEAGRAQSVIRRQVAQLVRLVDDLLDVTRISSNKVRLKLERVDLAEVVREVVQDHRHDFASKNVSLEVELPSNAVMINADRVRIEQSVGNLLLNAAKFTTSGDRTRITVAPDDQGHAVVRVEDTGVGMAPETVARLFEPFAQADCTLDRSKGGLGLGLALVKGLVELHHGEVKGTSAGPGRGAEFTIRLPLDTSQAPGTARAPAVSARRRWKILVIEDNVDSAETLKMVLEALGHEAEIALTGDQGIEKAHASRPELVLCDIGLPGTDGYGVARAMRAADDLRGTRLVALTGYAMPEDQRKAAEAGFDCHLAKPLRREMIEAVLGSLRAPDP